jgi:hypothetical protein
MASGRNRLYTLILLFCATGYIWLFISIGIANEEPGKFPGVCIIKHATNIPCPSCGSTRSALSFINGDLHNALYWNPVGILLVILMIAIPAWIVYDSLTKKNTFYWFYCKMEMKLKRKKIAIPLIVLVLMNWIWNIYKGL